MEKNLLDKQIEFLIQLKLQSLQRDYVSTLKYEQVKDCLVNSIWKNEIPKHIYQIANDINQLDIDTIIQYIRLNK